VGIRLAFLGTPQFAVPSLESLAAAGYGIAGVWTQPDRPRGRGRQITAPPVKECALRLGLAVHQPEKVRRPEVVETLRGLRLDAMVVVGYGQIIPKSILDIPPLGILNVHASLLPRYRGAAPVQWAIANGEARTGVTTMRINEGLDTGDILLAEETGIGPGETAPELGERLSRMGASLLIDTLRGLEQGTITPRPQDPSAATYAPILRKEDGRIDWRRPAAETLNRLRGFLPWPGAYTSFRGQTLHILRATIARPAGIEPGALAPSQRHLVVTCGAGSAIELLEVQLEGRKRISAQAFLNGHHPSRNERLGELGT